MTFTLLAQVNKSASSFVRFLRFLISGWLACLGFCLLTSTSSGVEVMVAAEATIQGGTNQTSNVDEAAAGYIHTKYSVSLNTARKAYFQFDLTGQDIDTNAPAWFTVSFIVTNKQRVQLWALDQPYPSFDAEVTWNTAQANETNSNRMLTNGAATATHIGSDELVPVGGELSHSFLLPNLGGMLFSNRITLVLSGVYDAGNNAGGLRIQRANSVLSFGPTNPPSVNTTHYDVYLAAGQSNMDGRGKQSDLVGDLSSWNQPQADVPIYYVNPINSDPYQPTYNTGWQLLRPGWSVPPGFGGVLPSTTFGPTLSFARTVADANTNRHLAIIKISQGGTDLRYDWNPTNGYLYVTFTNFVRAALQQLTNNVAGCTLRGMIWHQGESDGSLSTEEYQARLSGFIAAVRRDLGSSNLPFVVGELATNRSLTVRAAQSNVAQVIPYVGFASSSNLQTLAPDDPHFTAASALIMGQRMAAALEVPPLLLSNVSLAGSNLLITATGLARAACALEATTNLTGSPGSWTVVATNIFDASGRTIFAPPFRPDATALFLRLKSD